jgi:CubicO group peptidase (beta-lactamase class C family)
VKSEEIEKTIEQAISSGAFPGIALVAAKGPNILYQYYSGWAQLYPVAEKLTWDTIFDLSSLTKPIATTTAIMLLLQKKLLSLTDRVQDYLPRFRGKGKERVTLSHLLTHNSGLPSWKPYYKAIIQNHSINFARGKSFIVNQVLEEELIYEPGQKILYSDLGFILLGVIIEHITQESLDTFCQRNIFYPLGLSNTFFINLKNKYRDNRVAPTRFAATEHCPWRGRVLRGEVQDENAFAMGGVAGHAGLFSNAQDIYQFAQTMLSCYRGKNDFISQNIVQTFFLPQVDGSGATRALGWDIPSVQNSSAGKYFSSHSIGHLGFTGTSLWIDLEREIILVLLTNRVHPDRANENIKHYRPLIHNLIMEGIDGSE